MFTLRRSAAAFFVFLSLVVSVLLTDGSPARACLACYRSPDWLVADSQLIIIGRVESVVANKVPIKIGQPPKFFPGGDNEDRPGPTRAKVRVLRTLKGQTTREFISVESGPILSCAPWPVHSEFTVGQQLIFILSRVNDQGEACIHYAGSVLRVMKLEMIEQRIVREANTRYEYIEHIREQRSEVYAKGIRLAADMKRLWHVWPDEPVIGSKTYEFDVNRYKQAYQELAERLVSLDVEMVRLAQVVALDDKAGIRWFDHPLWIYTQQRFVEAKRNEVIETERRRLRALLHKVGVADDKADQYMKNLGDRYLDLELSFPPQAPRAYRKMIVDDFTTDFILRYYHYDRGSIFSDTGMSFDKLSQLDAQRVGTIIASLYGSDDEQLRLVAIRAIERLPIPSFAELVLFDMIDDNESAWSYLTWPGKEEQNRQRLEQLISLSQSELTIHGQCSFWHAMLKGECFKPVCLSSAIRLLKKYEPQVDEPEPGTDLLATMLRDYLDAAVERKKPDERKATVEDYSKLLEIPLDPPDR